MKVDVIIIGAGLAGAASAAALAKTGHEVALIDARADYPPEFRAEKFGPMQMAHLERMGLAEAAMARVTRHTSVQIARYGHIVAENKTVEYSFRYADLVNGVRAAIPERVRRILGRVADIATGPERQSVTMTDGTQVEGRLLVVATGSGDAIRTKIGMGRTVLSHAHSLVFGFSLAAPPADYPFESLCIYGKGPKDRISYIGIFRIGDEMRVNLFVYRTLDDPWTQRFRSAPAETLLETMPELSRLCGDLTVKGGIAVRPIDLTMATDYRRDGVVLIGDAFRTCCPIIGMGVVKVLTDVDRLCNHYVPRWLGTPGVGADKIGAFYDDEIKRECDEKGHAMSLYARSIATDPGLVWRARRIRNAAVRRGLYAVRHAGRELLAQARSQTAQKS